MDDRSPFWNTSYLASLADSRHHELKEDAPAYPKGNAIDTNVLAPPIIVYADLISTGDPRNLEAAKLLRDEYITEPDGTD
ncbi:type IV toxin-antitoxin system AbiEi family antitoxin [Granulosicoccus sp. 3-233]|uniref:type IV toxin-antitoxin system AbiEi family antitoxin n=1 Tax=Granulosicoccus sp. 3-233 TaxID=3417969 RepID=UPI003D327250